MRAFTRCIRSVAAPAGALTLAGLWLALSPLGSPLAAQQADVIRGQVTAAAAPNRPIANASVSATSIARGVSRSTRTDTDGRYTIVFPGGDGDYIVSVSAIGYAPRRFEVKRLVDEDILIGDVRLSSVNPTLDTVRTLAARNRPTRSDTSLDVGGAERSVNSGMVAPDQAGNLAAMASSLPGVLFVQGIDGDPSGYSVLGLDGSQNSTTLNGMNSAATDLPRDADVSAVLATSPYDVSQGQFSGGRLNLRLSPGSNYLTRRASLLGNAPAAEWTDATGRALGQQYTNLNLSGGAGGPISYNNSFYNVSYQLGRRGNDLPSLLDDSPLGLRAAGIAPDSLARLTGILGKAQLPTSVPGFPANRLGDQGLLLGSLDFAPSTSSTGQAFNVTFTGDWNRLSPVSSLSSMLPSAAMRATRWDAQVQAHHTNYYGFVLSETGLALTTGRQFTTPYDVLPSGTVLVGSTFAGGHSAVLPIGFGGSPIASSASIRSVDLTNQLSWMSASNQHRLKLTTELRHDADAQQSALDALGAFTFNSLADLENGQAASFTRALSPRIAHTGETIAGLSLGDSYRPSADVQIVYGARLDAGRFDGAPAPNAAVPQTFGARNDRVPSMLAVSPRIGFSWRYGTSPTVGAFAGAARVPRAIVQGGVGVFQNTLNVGLPANAMVTTGLAGASQQIGCVGSATPVPDWASYAADATTIPAACADGSVGTPFSSAAPNVALFAPDYSAQRSIRGNLRWTGAVLDNRLMASINGVYSVNLNQPRGVDLNFNPAARFTLPGEAGRPVYVDPSSIVPATGAIALTDSRMSTEFNHVTELRSDLTSHSRQLSVQLSPAGDNMHYTWGLNYVLNRVTDQASGFSNTAGNPLVPSLGRSDLDWRHELQFDVGYNLLDAVRLFWVQAFFSGTPYTPMVSSDVNGDGYADDRAFVFDPSTASDAALRSAMTTLLQQTTSGARDCLGRQLGHLAARNSCEGPWTSTASMSISFNPVRIHMPERTTLSFSISNPLAAADVLLHGENHLHQWGQPFVPDDRLLVVRAFDASSASYTYQVNPRFGQATQSSATLRRPAALTALLRVDLGPTRTRQDLVRTLDIGRSTKEPKLTATEVKGSFGTAGLANPMSAILRAADDMHLTGPQADSIATLNRWYAVRLDSIWTPLATELAHLPARYDHSEAYARYQRAREATVDLLIKLAPRVTGLLSAEQRRRLPPGIAAFLDRQYLKAIRSGTRNLGGPVFPIGVGVPSVAGQGGARGGGPGGGGAGRP